MTTCDHDCCLCVTDARCERDHLAALGVCDRHIRLWITEAALAGCPGIVGFVMRATGGRANPQRVAELAAEVAS